MFGYELKKWYYIVLKMLYGGEVDTLGYPMFEITETQNVM